VNSAHIQVVNWSFVVKGSSDYLLFAAGQIGDFEMRNCLYIDALEHGTPFSVKVASVAVSALLVLIVAVPVLAVGARIFA
jgi:hypothetical protein